jgi:hypothetical protein
MNRGVLVAMGLGNARMPRFSSVQEKKEDPQIAAQIITQMGQAGLPLRLDEVYHKIGFSKPREGVDEVFEGAAPDAGSMPGMPGGMPEPGGQPFTEKPSEGGPG